MAYRLANSSGSFGTAATWDTGTNVPTLNASANIIVSVAGIFGVTYTAPNITNASTGVAVYLTAKGTATTITATLQENSVDTAHTQTITLANVELGWIYFRPTTPYVFTAVTAGRYRWKFTVDAGTTTTVAQIATANPCYIATDNRNLVPASGDNAFVIAINNATPVTVTCSGTQTVGTNVVSGINRSITNAIQIANQGALQMSTAANSTLNHRGDIVVDPGGEFSCGTSGSPLSGTYLCQIISNTATAGIWVSTGGKSYLQGNPRTFPKTTHVSGLGTAASPLITADAVDWNVGDEIYLAPTGNGATNYNETEVRFIITKNSTTSYVLSSTSGGSENALLYTHTGGVIGNFTQNIVIKGLNAATTTYYNAQAQLVAGNVDVDWVRFEFLTNTTFLGAVPTKVVQLQQNCDIDNCVGINGAAGIFQISSTIPGTVTNLMTYNNTATVGVAGSFANIIMNGCKDKTFTNCVSFGSTAYGLGLVSSSCVVQDSTFVGNSNANAIASNIAVSGGQNQLINVDSHASRTSGLYQDGGANNTYIECSFGTKGTNVTDVWTSTGAITSLFSRCNFGSATLINNYLNMTLGSEVRFDTMNGTDNNHAWFNSYGYGQAELSVIRSPGLAVKLVPQNLAVGFTWSFKTPVVQNSIAGFRGFFLKNATLGTAVCTIQMYLPGNPVAGGLPDVQQVLNNTTGAAFTDADEQSVSLTTFYSGDIPGAATIVVNVKSNTPGAALYCDDFFNAGDRTTTYDSITGLNLWTDGKPLDVISPSVASADDIAQAVRQAVWSDTDVYDPGTKGKLQKDAADSAELASIR